MKKETTKKTMQMCVLIRCECECMRYASPKTGRGEQKGREVIFNERMQVAVRH